MLVSSDWVFRQAFEVDGLDVSKISQSEKKLSCDWYFFEVCFVFWKGDRCNGWHEAILNEKWHRVRGAFRKGGEPLLLKFCVSLGQIAFFVPLFLREFNCINLAILRLWNLGQIVFLNVCICFAILRSFAILWMFTILRLFAILRTFGSNCWPDSVLLVHWAYHDCNRDCSSK